MSYRDDLDGRASRPGVDATTILTVLVVLLLAIPSQLVFAPLGGAGSPAQLFGLVLLLAWTAERVWGPPLDIRSDYWIRAALLVFLVAALASYVAATIRPIDEVELRSADRGLMSVFAWSGVLLYAMDGITDRARLDLLLRRICVAGALLALLGLTQFITHATIVDVISIPGLTANQEVAGGTERGGFTRPAGTAIHPIEFGGVLTLIFPLALHFGLIDSERRGFSAWLPAISIGAMLMISLSRTAILATAVVVVVVLSGWPAKMRRGMYGAALAMLLAVYVAVPGMLGTLAGLFTGVATDSGTRSRTDSYALAWGFISQRPLFGRGMKTFMPSYRILDNQFLATTIEMGILGVAALLAIFSVTIYVVLRAPAISQEDRSLSRSLAAAVAGCGVSFTTFDAFSFPMVPTLLFLLIGCAAVLVKVCSRDVAAAIPPVSARS